MDNRLGPLPTRGLAREELSPARRAVLDTLIELGGRRTVVELAAQLGQHPNTVREHLESLVATELVARTLRHSAGRGRPAALYRATLAATPAGPEYAVLAEALVGYLARTVPAAVLEEHALAAGRDWGRAMRERHLVDGPPLRRAPDAGDEASTGTSATAGAADWVDSVERLGQMFERAGFGPETVTDPDGARTQRLRRCPVLALAKDYPELVCTGHLGMAQEVLGHEGIDPARVSLEAFAEPGACLLRVAPPADQRSTDG
ncbi:helix-turn-helix transcriptional regulator [Georgenia sp. MJ170]|uniref:helix-turn-helix transcriptional regulator n=1 Tax=Georgenia sunbinii TaxID=3117728 RepID=UPI002F25F182